MIAAEPFMAFLHGARNLLQMGARVQLRPMNAEREFAGMQQLNGYPTIKFQEIARGNAEPVTWKVFVFDHGLHAHSSAGASILLNGTPLIDSFDQLYERHWQRADLWWSIVAPLKAGVPSHRDVAFVINCINHMRNPLRRDDPVVIVDPKTYRGVVCRYLSHVRSPNRRESRVRVTAQTANDQEILMTALPGLKYVLRQTNALSWQNVEPKISPWTVGMAVLVDYQDGQGYYWKAKITNIRPNGRLDLRYDSDGSPEKNIAPKWVQAQE